MKKRRLKPIPRDEELTLRLLIRSKNEGHIRQGLRRICELYQQGRRFNDFSDIHSSVRSFVFDRSVDVERWALKVIAEIRDPKDHDLIRARITSPPNDPENLTWAVAAFFAVATPDQIAEAFRTGLISRDGIALLAYNFTERLEGLDRGLPTIDIEKADSITLKWACLCFATDRVTGHIFKPRFKQIDQLGTLNTHHVSEVAQYSLYAMSRMPAANYTHMKIRQQELLNKPPNIRRYAYRLFCKDAKHVSANFDFLDEVISNDRDVDAQEGLALGLRAVWFDGLPEIMCDWLVRVRGSGGDEGIEIAILEHMAKNSQYSPSYEKEVIEVYCSGSTSSLWKARLKEAGSTSSIYRKFLAADEAESRQLFIFHGDFVMGSKQDISGSNIQIGVNTVGGDSIDNSVVQQLRSDLDRLLVMARDHSTPESQVVVDAIQEFQKRPTPSAGTKLLESLKKWSSVGALSAEVAEKAKDMVDALSGLFS